MNLPAELDKLEDRLTAPARFSAWIGYESAGDSAAANRLRKRSEMTYTLTQNKVDVYRNALADVLTCLYAEVKEALAVVQVFDLGVLHLANAFDEAIDFACYLFDEDELPDNPPSIKRVRETLGDEQTHKNLDRWEPVRDVYFRRVAIQLRAFEAFCADERIDPAKAMHALGFPLADKLEELRDELDLVDLTDDTGRAEVDGWREGFLRLYSSTITRSSPHWEGLKARRAERAGAPDSSEMVDDLSYLDDVAAATQEIAVNEILLTPIASTPSQDDDDEGWSEPAATGATDCAVCTTMSVADPQPALPNDTLCAEHASWRPDGRA